MGVTRVVAVEVIVKVKLGCWWGKWRVESG